MRIFLVTLLVLAFGCSPAASDPDAGRPEDGARIGDSSVPDDARPPDAPLDIPLDAPATDEDRATVAFGPHPTGIAVERTVCVVIDAGNSSARQVRAIRTSLPVGSHHMIVYRSEEALDATPRECFPFADGGEAIFIAETVSAELIYPEDAGLEFRAHQHIRLEIHEVNYTGAPIDITASVEFEFYPLGTAPRDPVQFLFTGDMSIYLPPRQTTTATSFHRVPSGARIFALTSHTHSLGTYASIHDATSAADTSGVLLHESTNWAEPPLDTFAPPRVLAAGRGLRLSCTWQNTSDAAVSFGLGFEDEMCFLWAYWY